MAYITITELKAALGIASADTADDAALTLAADAASRMVDKHTNRRFSKDAAAVERFYPVPKGAIRLDIDDLTGDNDPLTASTEPVLKVPTGETPADFILMPANAPANGEPYTHLVTVDPVSGVATFQAITNSAVSVTGIFGWPSVPAEVKQAALIQALRLVQRRHSPYGIAGSPEAGSEMRLLSRLDPDVEALVRPYVKGWYVQ